MTILEKALSLVNIVHSSEPISINSVSVQVILTIFSIEINACSVASGIVS